MHLRVFSTNQNIHWFCETAILKISKYSKRKIIWKIMVLIMLKIDRSSHQEVFCIKNVLRNFTKFTGKHLYLRGLQLYNFIKKRFRYRCFLVNFVKFLETAFSIEHLCWLLLVLHRFVIPAPICKLFASICNLKSCPDL